jgi:hypothetical protein
LETIRESTLPLTPAPLATTSGLPLGDCHFGIGTQEENDAASTHSTTDVLSMPTGYKVSSGETSNSSGARIVN